MDFLKTLSIVLFSTALAGQCSKKIGIPAVIGQLLVGIFLGPAVLNWVANDHFMHYFAEIGVILLMFMAGLESDLALLKKYLKPATSVAIFGVIVPIIVIYGLGRLFNFDVHQALFLGIIFAATSVSISVEVLKELKKIDTKEGTTILGAAVIDDIMAVLILSTLVSIFSQNNSQQIPLSMSLLMQLGYFLGVALLFLITPFIVKNAQKLTLPASEILVALILCFLMAYLADLVGLSGVVGAFFAGVSLGQTSLQHKINAGIEPIGYAVFIPMFFVSIGLNMTFKGFLGDLIFIIPLTILALLTKWIGCGFGAKILGMDYLSANIIGAGMVSRGEMALIIAQIGASAKLLSSQYYSGVIVAIILTTVLAPFMLKDALQRQK